MARLDALADMLEHVNELTSEEQKLVATLYTEILFRRTQPYRIAIVVALPKELAATKAMLRDLRLAHNNISTVAYFAGTIASIVEDGDIHHVLLAQTLQMGNSAAAVAVTSILKDFPRVDHVLMVGIAGGVPALKDGDNDIRLGDIVISTGTGVVQYDMTKIEKKAVQVRSQAPIPDPDMVRAVNNLESERVLGHYPWDTHIEHIASRTENGGRPDPKTDRVTRERQTPETDPRRQQYLPIVHYGTIGSANALVKRESLRNELKRRFKVLAVEMEGSGVADAAWAFRGGYLLIRGICDYCDMEKNDVWQGYAAAAAAGYARALIESLPAPTHQEAYPLP